MFERFTKEAKRAVTRAQVEAADRRDARIGAEHLLISVLATAGPGSPVTALGLTAPALREGLAELDESALASVGVHVSPGASADRPSRPRHIPFNGAAKSVLTGALKEAIGLGQRAIGVEHILLGVTALPPTDRAIRLLGRAGARPDALRDELLAAMRRAS
jgi:ATP-dependent Clp protease ATP-binding subunit ClpA